MGDGGNDSHALFSCFDWFMVCRCENVWLMEGMIHMRSSAVLFSSSKLHMCDDECCDFVCVMKDILCFIYVKE